MNHITLLAHLLLRHPATTTYPASLPAAGPKHAECCLAAPVLSQNGLVTAKRQNFLWLKAHLNFLEAALEMEPETALGYWFHLRYLWLWAGNTSLSQAVALQPALPAFLAAPTLDVSREPEPLTRASRRRVIQAARCFFVWAKVARPTQFQALAFGWIEALQPSGQVGSSSCGEPSPTP